LPKSIFKKVVAMRGGKEQAAVLLDFGFVFAQSQVLLDMLLRSSLAKIPKFLAAARLQLFLKRSRVFKEQLMQRAEERFSLKTFIAQRRFLSQK
jgi:hypothetical protein